MFLTFIRDDQKKFTLGGRYSDTASWGILEIKGIGDIEYEVSTEKNAVGDGETVTAVKMPKRNIDIVAKIKDALNNNIERSKALSYFSSNHEFILYIEREGDIRWIECIVQKVKCTDRALKAPLKLELALVCPDPYFNSKDNYGKNIASVKSGFGFPFISREKKGFNVGVYNFAKKVEIENTGDTETYFTIRIEAFGEVKNPKVMKDGAYIRLLDTLSMDDVVEIDLVSCTIRKNGVNCIGKVDRTSSFSGMVLPVGDNTVSFSADDGDTNMRVLLYYNLRYLGA